MTVVRSKQVARKLTPLTLPQMAAALKASYTSRTFEVPTRINRAMLENILAVAALENGNGSKIVQHNWGNVMATPAWREDHPFWERKNIELKPRFFRAYPSHAVGIRNYLNTLHGKRHKAAILLAQQDNPAGMVDSLFDSNYVVAIPADKHPRHLTTDQQHEEYTKAVVSIREKLRRLNLFDMTDTSPSTRQASTGRGGIFIPLALAGGLAFMLRGKKT